MRTVGSRKNINRRLGCVMQQEFRTPVEQIRFVGIHLCGFLILPNCFERMPGPLLNVAQQMMKFRRVPRCKQGFGAATGALEIPRLRIG